MNEREQVARLRRALKYSWPPFFSRFGKLTKIQLEAIPEVLEGKNVVISSPTASGKTEAVIAPLVELAMRDKWESLAILYVVPTRALANDSLSRIEGPLRDMGLETVLKHGDKPRLPKSLLNCLITTPESLDSLICRRGEVFAGLRTVVLDEIHLLDNTYRGDQLRILLNRLRPLADTDFTIHLLSATLSSPQEIASRYVESPTIVQIEDNREIEQHYVKTLEKAIELVKKNRWKKILCFCNYRESVEAAASQLGELLRPYPVCAHHGSLSRQLREEAEQTMKEAQVAACVATSTLEVGIDIGDIDVILLAEVPWSVSSLLQRIGRGNRRDERTRTIAIVTDSEKQIMKAMFNVASSGKLPVESYEADLSVVVQQLFSILFENPQGVPKEVLANLLESLARDEELSEVMRHLKNTGWIESRAGCWFASTQVMDDGEKGRIHSNIPDSGSYRVIDVSSGKEVGKIQGAFDEVFVLAQQVWKVVSVASDRILAKRFRGKGASPPTFHRQRNVGKFHHLLPKNLRSKTDSPPQTP